jgi:hypothetical protein
MAMRPVPDTSGENRLFLSRNQWFTVCVSMSVVKTGSVSLSAACLLVVVREAAIGRHSALRIFRDHSNLLLQHSNRADH